MMTHEQRTALVASTVEEMTSDWRHFGHNQYDDFDTFMEAQYDEYASGMGELFANELGIDLRVDDDETANQIDEMIDWDAIDLMIAEAAETASYFV